MHTRDTRQRERILTAIKDNPGISLTGLFPKTQLMTADERTWHLADLVARGQIIEIKSKAATGPAKTTYRIATPAEAPEVKPAAQRIADDLATIRDAIRRIEVAIGEVAV